MQGAKETEHRDEACREQGRPPEPLNDPHREKLRPDAEERAHREQVPVGLVLQPAPRHLRIPQMECTLQESPRIHVEVVLGVLGNLAGPHRPGNGPDDEQPRENRGVN